MVDAISLPDASDGFQTAKQWFEQYAAAQPAAEAAMLRQAFAMAQETYPADAATPMGEPLLPHLLKAAKLVAEIDLLPEAEQHAGCLRNHNGRITAVRLSATKAQGLDDLRQALLETLTA